MCDKEAAYNFLTVAVYGSFVICWCYVVAQMAVHENHRDKGIGHSLIQAALGHIHGCDLTRIELKVQTDKAAPQIGNSHDSLLRYRLVGYVPDVLRYLPSWEQEPQGLCGNDDR